MQATRRLKELILIKGISYRELADIADVPYATIKSVFVRGVENSSVELVLRICKALGVTLNDLFGETDINDIEAHIKMLNAEGVEKVKSYVSDMLCINRYRK
ncbi:MAG: helix-turn-helix transcriptional regulator [Clostridia bacterium]|nr:helix-turn-helix transcriptional regulator [Clostridia bacterium]